MQNGPRTEPRADTQQSGPFPGKPAASALPPTPPTQAAPAANTLPGPMAATPLNAAGTTSSRPHRAQVTYENGLLNVRANDSSLNQILRAICSATGLTITGGVTDQRVFGNYGPASTASILATLLDGTGTNMLLIAGDATSPPVLTLTPRGGAASPPSPSAVPDDSIADTPAPPPPVAAPTTQPVTATAPANPVPNGNPIPPHNVLGSQYNSTPTASQIPTTNSVGIDTLSAPSTTPAVSGIVDSPNPPAGATPAPDATPAAPGALTPEAVYQKLLQMQKQAQPPASTPPATPPQ
jgi:hypothetical protein